MGSRVKRLFAIAALGLFAVLPFASQVSAVDPIVESITLSPVAKRYELQAGETRTDTLTVVNDGKEAYDFTAYAKPYSVSSENYSPDFVTEASNSDAYRWVKFEKSKYHLEAGASMTVSYTISVPVNAGPGGHYGVLFVETQPKGPVGGNAVVRKKRVGAILYTTVKGTYEIGGEQTASDIPFLQLTSPLTARLTTTNTGNTDFIDTVVFRVSDLFGGLKYEETKEYPILPQTARKMTLEWKTAPDFGVYKVEVISKFLDQTHTSSSFVLMMPAWALGVVGLIVVGSIIYLVLRRRY